MVFDAFYLEIYGWAVLAKCIKSPAFTIGGSDTVNHLKCLIVGSCLTLATWSTAVPVSGT